MTENNPHPILNGRYEFLKNLGDGHTANVYLANDFRTQSKVAIKVIKN